MLACGMETVMKKIIILPNRDKKIPTEKIEALCCKLRDWGCDAVVEEIPSPGEDSSRLSYADLLVVLGGDGTIIDVARVSAGMNIPITGVNFGHVGYMAEIESDCTDRLRAVIDGKCNIQKRMMLDIAVVRGDKAILTVHPALNDAVLSNGPIPKLLGFDIFCDGLFAQHMRSDGIIISTPTGSSAYSMSAGGPVIDPEVQCICATPICPHLLNARPVIFSPDCIMEIRNAECRGNNIYLSVDGKEVIELAGGDVIRIKRSKCTIPLVRVGKESFIETLNSKLSGD